jgi:cytochrome oxidase assembly protein ShyY1
VQAVTEVGAGFWDVDGYTVLINRGFVPPTQRGAASRSQGQIATSMPAWTSPPTKGQHARDGISDQSAGRDGKRS